MTNMTRYVHIPEIKSYFKAQLNCCYEVVSYDDRNLGITSKNDQEDDALNSYDLICRCHPYTKIIEITEDEYYTKRKEVLDLIEERSHRQ